MDLSGIVACSRTHQQHRHRLHISSREDQRATLRTKSPSCGCSFISARYTVLSYFTRGRTGRGNYRRGAIKPGFIPVVFTSTVRGERPLALISLSADLWPAQPAPGHKKSGGETAGCVAECVRVGHTNESVTETDITPISCKNPAQYWQHLMDVI